MFDFVFESAAKMSEAECLNALCELEVHKKLLDDLISIVEKRLSSIPHGDEKLITHEVDVILRRGHFRKDLIPDLYNAKMKNLRGFKEVSENE